MRTLQDKHNAAVITKALAERNGQSALGLLRVYASDDETLERAARATPGVVVVGRVAHLLN